jgi:hypothetical protein
MTIAMAWVAPRKDGRRHLYIASDSRTRGAMVMDCCPKILTLPRSDCAICFAGNTAATYPLMMQLANAIAAHGPAHDRSLDIATLRAHLLRVFSDIVAGIHDAALPMQKSDVQFIFGGYSWLKKDFCIWTIHYSEARNKFAARPANNFHPQMNQIAFIGDVAKDFRKKLIARLSDNGVERSNHFEYIPLALLRDELRAADGTSSIGGPPQLVRIAEHMNTRILAVEWEATANPQEPRAGNRAPTILGRPLFDYENVDYWVLNPDTFDTERPRAFGYRQKEQLSSQLGRGIN